MAMADEDVCSVWHWSGLIVRDIPGSPTETNKCITRGERTQTRSAGVCLRLTAAVATHAPDLSDGEPRSPWVPCSCGGRGQVGSSSVCPSLGSAYAKPTG